MKPLAAALLSLVAFVGTSSGQSSSDIFDKPGGLVPDQRTAIAIAEAVLFPIYGEKNIRQQRPYVVKHARGKWIIEGAPLPAGFAGGVFHIVIRQRDAKILEITHEV